MRKKYNYTLLILYTAVHNAIPKSSINGYTTILSAKLCNTIHEIVNVTIPRENANNR